MSYTEDSEDALVARAYRAYFAACRRQGAIADQPPLSLCSLEELDDGRQYVVLCNNYRTLAVYRVRRVDGVLRGMKRWPKALERRYPETTGIRDTLTCNETTGIRDMDGCHEKGG